MNIQRLEYVFKLDTNITRGCRNTINCLSQVAILILFSADDNFMNIQELSYFFHQYLDFWGSFLSIFLPDVLFVPKYGILGAI